MKGKFSRWYAYPGRVILYQLQSDGSRVFKGYQTPGGEWCDENGRKLGKVEFTGRDFR